VSETTVRTARVSRALQAIEQRFGEAKPSAFVADERGNTLVDLSLSPLPGPLTDVTMLFTLAMVLRECDRGAMSPQTPIGDLLAPDVVEGLCVYRGKDLSSQVTMEHLIAHQSGIPDFYQPHGRGTISLMRQSLDRDRAWTLEQALEIARHYPAKFAPGTRGKADYSATNYQLLGAILAQSTGMSFEQLITLRVTTPLGLKNTFVFSPAHYERYFSLTAVRSGTQPLRNPRALASFGASGSVVSSAKDAVDFLRAFWTGTLFDPSWLDWITQNPRSLGRGVAYTNGLMRMRSGIPRRVLLGHSGSSGTAALFDPLTRNVGFLALNTVMDPKIALATLGKIMQQVRR